MTGHIVHNRSKVQAGVKGDDGKTYWVAPGNHTPLPVTVGVHPLPKGVRVTPGVQTPEFHRVNPPKSKLIANRLARMKQSG